MAHYCLMVIDCFVPFLENVMPNQNNKYVVPKRKIRDLLAGTLSSFISRNNDMWGYWGIGVLCRETLKNHVFDVQLDILQQTASFTSAHEPSNAEAMQYSITRQPVP